MIETSSDDTIQSIYVIWKYIYKALRLKNILIRNVTDEVIVPKSTLITKSKDVNTDIDTLKKVIDGLRNKKTSNLLERESLIHALWTMYYTGLRPGECFALKRSNIDLQNGYLTVTDEVGSSLTERKTIRQTKTPESNRRVPIVKELSIILQEWMFTNSNEYLFCDKNGEFLDSTRIGGILNRISKKLDVKFNMYRLRHQFSTDLIMQNNDPRTIMELMGHNNTNMTISYARSNDEKKKETLSKRKANYVKIVQIIVQIELIDKKSL